MTPNRKNKASEIEEEIRNIWLLTNEGKYQEALAKLYDCTKNYPDDESLQFNKSGLLIDAGIGLKDVIVVQKGLEAGEHNLQNKRYGKYKTTTLYNLANGYLSLFQLSERDRGIESIPKSPSLQKAKSYFQQALSQDNHLNKQLKKQVLVNYGNCLSTLGRSLEALYVYDEALKLDRNFSMAIANKAKTQKFFADISGQYCAAIYIEAYQAMQSAINQQDLLDTGGSAAKQGFEKELINIESHFKNKDVLKKTLKHSLYETEKLSDFEKFYLSLCSKEKLFLNFHIHHDQCEASITDPIFISLITEVDDDNTFYKYAKYINQIKEDYAVARLLFVQSQYKREDFDNISKRTTFVYSLDYSQFNLYIGLLKSSFKEAYNILDKIAVFINDYYELNFPEEDVYFTSVKNRKKSQPISIWEENKIIRNEILQSKNISLYALYDIFIDFQSGKYREIQKIRNALTHRKLVIFDATSTDKNKEYSNDSIGYYTMLDKTIDVMRLAKSAIVYLVNFVNMEENRKKGRGKTIQITADTSQFL